MDIKEEIDQLITNEVIEKIEIQKSLYGEEFFNTRNDMERLRNKFTKLVNEEPDKFPYFVSDGSLSIMLLKLGKSNYLRISYSPYEIEIVDNEFDIKHEVESCINEELVSKVIKYTKLNEGRTNSTTEEEEIRSNIEYVKGNIIERVEREPEESHLSSCEGFMMARLVRNDRQRFLVSYCATVVARVI